MKKKYKIMLGVFAFVVLTILVILGGGYKSYSEEYNKQIKIETTDGVIVNKVKVDPSIKNPLTNINPRRSFLNSSSQEVAYIDHEGNLEGIGNVTGKYGFFSWIGSEANKIAKGFFTNIQVSHNVNTTNITSQQYCNQTGCYNVEQFLSDTDSNFSTICSGDEAGLGNGTCFTSSLWLDDTTASVSDDWVNETGDTMTGNLVITNSNITISENSYMCLDENCNSWFKYNSSVTFWMLNRTANQWIKSNDSGLHLFGGT